MDESRDTYISEEDVSLGDTLLPIGETARLLGVAVGTVRRWDDEGRLSSTRTPGGQRRFARSEIERLKREGASA